MNWIEILLITLGISLDIFGVVACQGAQVAKIDKKSLAIGCAIVAFSQLVALYVGNFGASLLVRYDIKNKQIRTIYILSAIIFICLGIRMIWKAWKNENIVEHKEEKIDFRKFWNLAKMTAIYTLLAGAAFGFLGTSVKLLVIMIICFTVLVVIAGFYTGYRLGFEQKIKAYRIGGILLAIGGIDAILRYVVY